ncbi:MAG: trehalose-6-phosphate synthase [Ktedonobacteraceae bacterium]|nr:trehalose-6-phosphate synthase [Ktedonobacteraceae bacterium]
MPAQMTIHETQPQLIHANRLIIATNRGPVEYYLSQDKMLKHRRGAGGMVTALIEAGNHMEVTWVAMAMTEGDRVAFKESGLVRSPLRGPEMQLRYVTVPKTTYRKYYEVISNRTLWFLQHYMYDPVNTSISTQKIMDAWRNGYHAANQAIADAVNAEIEREDTTPVVMLHDYHLYLVAAMIRQRHPTIVTQQFIHIPWPDIRCWQFLPNSIAQDIYSGLVGNDIVGFQTERDAHNFLEGAHTLLDGAVVDFEEGAVWWQGHRTQARAYPISISVAEERRAVQSVAGKRATELLRPVLAEKTIMRVDRIEPTKNILRGFQAYIRVLDEHPELHGKVTFLAFLVPSRQSLPEYQRYTNDVMKIMEEINNKYGTETWLPVHPFCDNDRTRALAAMQFYDVLLVNPIIDGMNLVAKEGPVVNKRDGVLVLSRTAGAFQQMGKASIPTSPLDIEETAEALYQALTLPPEERAAKARQARLAVERYDLHEWLRRQIRDVNELLDLSARRLPIVSGLALREATVSLSAG